MFWLYLEIFRDLWGIKYFFSTFLLRSIACSQSGCFQGHLHIKIICASTVCVAVELDDGHWRMWNILLLPLLLLLRPK